MAPIYCDIGQRLCFLNSAHKQLGLQSAPSPVSYAPLNS